MPRRLRVDAELVRRGLARSRQHAAELIEAQRVLIDGTPARKAATQVETSQAVRVLDGDDERTEYVSRGGHKLAGALDALGAAGPAIEGRSALDAGASTGGFTDVLLRRGAARVLAVDVGYGQLDWRLRSDERVTVLDRTNVRHLKPEQVDPPANLVVADLSFISLTLVLPALLQVSATDADLLLMVKPQFEVGKDALGSGGVVRDTQQHGWAISKVATAAIELGADVGAVAPSPLPGPSGNVEYFVHLRAGVDPARIAGDDRLESRIAAAIAAGPAGQAS